MMMSLIVDLPTIVPLQNVVKDCRDEKDNFILEMAVFGEASYIISGDKDIQVLSPYKGISVLTLGQFKKMAGIDFTPPYPGTIPEI
jgi:predicted nucleic acid-binding protein